MKRLIPAVAVLGLLLAACASDPTDSEEYRDLEQQLADTEQLLAEVTAERDALVAAPVSEPSERYEKSLANQEAVEDILHNAESYGSKEEVIELLASYATDDAVMDDAVFGATGITSAWRQTLYGGGMDAEIDNYYRWLSDDGSQGGVLWVWHGTNLAGNQFQLPGISLNEYDEDGLLSYQYVVYPFPDDYVNEAVGGEGTPSKVFNFATNELCEWIDADTVSAIVADAYTEHGATPAVTGFEESWDSDDDRGCMWSVDAADPNEPRLAQTGLILTEPLDEAIAMGQTFAEHPALSEGVRVNQAAELPVGGYGEYVCGMEVRLSVEGHAETMEFWHCVPPDFDGDADAVLSIADGLLRAMGWVPVQGG